MFCSANNILQTKWTNQTLKYSAYQRNEAWCGRRKPCQPTTKPKQRKFKRTKSRRQVTNLRSNILHSGNFSDPFLNKVPQKPKILEMKTWVRRLFDNIEVAIVKVTSHKNQRQIIFENKTAFLNKSHILQINRKDAHYNRQRNRP